MGPLLSSMLAERQPLLPICASEPSPDAKVSMSMSCLGHVNVMTLTNFLDFEEGARDSGGNWQVCTTCGGAALAIASLETTADAHPIHSCYGAAMELLWS